MKQLIHWRIDFVIDVLNYFITIRLIDLLAGWLIDWLFSN